MSRPKGSKNKITIEVKEHIQNIVNNNIERIETELNTLQGRHYIESVLKLIEYIIPKAKENDLTNIPILEAPKIYLNGIELNNLNDTNISKEYKKPVELN